MSMKYNASEHAPLLKDLADRIRFLGHEGKIWLDEQRMLLMTVSAMASCRRELIEMIGEERAKGFFLRLGYQSGLKDAELARKLRPNSSDIEMFLTGPQLHALKGMVNVRPLKMDIDLETGHFYADIEWLDSFEVENHQSERLESAQPVC